MQHVRIRIYGNQETNQAESTYQERVLWDVEEGGAKERQVVQLAYG